MIKAENIQMQIRGLLNEMSLSRSACSGSLLKALRPLIDAGVIIEERSGAGRRLVVRDPAALQSFLHDRYPGTPIGEGAGTRVAGVAGFRNSKVFPCDTPEIVLVRAWSESALLKDGKSTGAASATGIHGLLSFLLSKDYVLHGIAALVENPLVFLQFERLGISANIALYGHGRASTRLLDWLASNEAPDFKLLHLPDYDPVGLTEFERLRARLGDRVLLHVPEDLPVLFARFGNTDLLQNRATQALLAGLRKSVSPQVRRVVGLIDRYNSGLEQEALLLTKR